MYRIAVLTDLKHEGEHYAKVINDYCINQKLFPLLETYQNQEVFFLCHWATVRATCSM